MNRDEALRRLDGIIDGIDQDECAYKEGWWETSTGAEFGARIKQDLHRFVDELLDARLDELRDLLRAYHDARHAVIAKFAELDLPSLLPLH
jgi:hypothetical protein